MRLPTNKTMSPTLEDASTFSEKLCFYCVKLDQSLETLRISISKYEDYKKNKNKLLSMDSPDDRA